MGSDIYNENNRYMLSLTISWFIAFDYIINFVNDPTIAMQIQLCIMWLVELPKFALAKFLLKKQNLRILEKHNSYEK